MVPCPDHEGVWQNCGLPFLAVQSDENVETNRQVRLCNLGKDFFLIQIGLAEDYDKNVGTKVMRMWEPNFKLSSVVCSLVAVWVCLPELPFEYYELRVLKKIGKTIGPVLRIDVNTTSEMRGRHVRICIQVDINKPLVRRILLEGVIQEIQYEGINSLCFSYGCIRHRQEGCLYTVQASSLMQRPEEEGMQGEGTCNKASGPKSQIEGNPDGGVTEDYGL